MSSYQERKQEIQLLRQEIDTQARIIMDYYNSVRAAKEAVGLRLGVHPYDHMIGFEERPPARTREALQSVIKELYLHTGGVPAKPVDAPRGPAHGLSKAARKRRSYEHA